MFGFLIKFLPKIFAHMIFDFELTHEDESITYCNADYVDNNFTNVIRVTSLGGKAFVMNPQTNFNLVFRIVGPVEMIGCVIGTNKTGYSNENHTPEIPAPTETSSQLLAILDEVLLPDLANLVNSYLHKFEVLYNNNRPSEICNSVANFTNVSSIMIEPGAVLTISPDAHFNKPIYITGRVITDCWIVTFNFTTMAHVFPFSNMLTIIEPGANYEHLPGDLSD
jgi:hypothetical protein